ncbi:energy-coupling factor transporter transmembrane component T [Cohnella luojiensis]|uniref:Energy-coupling factor transporter transmembrane protein EcfT n=1 Tax=Cohnella luojiensis TaxID=652876 RepID=A0A4Y8LRE1_9BACL|nr:energy-coupling factor transporter transmembrane component T [Cohnella luojiensis]TFE24005.1 energy-coupling factor transporter transmembrane protein EcfT [Cohnella luojiensis]
MKEGFGFRSLHPIVIGTYYAGGITFGMLLFHPLILLAGWAAAVIINVHLDGGREWRKWSLPMLIGIVLIVVVNPILSHRGRTVLYYLGDIPITLESVIYGVTLAMSMLNVLTFFVTYRLTMTEQKFLYLFTRISPKAALIAMMAMGLVPRLRRRMQELMLIQRTRGVTVLEGTIAQRARNGARLIGTLLSWTLEDALQTADSMQARGYGTGTRSSYLDYRFRMRDWGTMGGLLACSALLLLTWGNGHGFMVIYPRLGSFALSLGDGVALAAYIGYLLLPLGWEWRDRRAWLITNYGR